MDEPRINVRGKEMKRTKKVKKTDTLNWAGRKQGPFPHESGRNDEQENKAIDYWTPYLQNVHKKQKRFKPRPRPLPTPQKKGSNRTGGVDHSLLKLIVSGGSAVLIGTLMGLLILKVFVGSGVPEGTNTIDTHLEKSSQSTESDTSQPAEAGAEAELPGIESVWVQGGVYSGKEGAEAFAAAQREDGQAAVVRKMGDQYRVFFGVGLTRDHALSIAGEIKDAGGDVYLKNDLSVAAVPLDNLSLEPGQKLQKLAEEGQQIVSALASWSAAGIGGTNIQADLSGEMKAIEQTHRAFVTSHGELKDVLPDDQQQVLNTMDQALAQSIEAAKQYQQEASPGYLWQVQEGLMQYLLAYQQLGNSVGQ